VKYHPDFIEILTSHREAGGGTVLGGQFNWGGFLPKGNGGVPRLAQRGRQSRDECKGISELNCETDRSSRCESRA
jgi:hypothetical protein